MSTYVSSLIQSALTPLHTSRALLTNTYTFLSTSSTEAKDLVRDSIKYITTGNTTTKSLTTNSALLLGIAPRLIDLTKSTEIEVIVRRLLSILGDCITIIQTAQVQAIILSCLDLLRTPPVRSIIANSSALLIDVLKLLQANETAQLRKQFEVIATSLFGDFMAARKGGAAPTNDATDSNAGAEATYTPNVSLWITLHRYIILLEQQYLVTPEEALVLRSLARKQSTELLILYQGYGVLSSLSQTIDQHSVDASDVKKQHPAAATPIKQANGIHRDTSSSGDDGEDDLLEVDENTRLFVKYAREMIADLAII